MPITNREKQGNVKNNKGMRNRKRNIRERQTDKLQEKSTTQKRQSKTKKTKKEKNKKNKGRLKQTCQLRKERTVTLTTT